MSTINNLSGVNSMLSPQIQSGTVPPVGGGDSDSDTAASSAARTGRASNFLQAIGQSLERLGVNTVSLSAPVSVTAAQANETNPNQSAQGALQSFMKSLLGALHQADGNDGMPITDKDNDSDGGGVTTKAGQKRGGVVAKIQNLIQQISAGSQGPGRNAPSASLNDLNSSFQNLLAALNASSPSSPQNAPTLQALLQNIAQDLGSGQNISGAVIDTKI